jgi:hypothetical protein
VLETRHGPLVEALIDAGFTVLPVNPDLVARRRGPAKKKDDAEAARICCLLALDQYAALRKLIPHGQTGTELRAIAKAGTIALAAAQLLLLRGQRKAREKRMGELLLGAGARRHAALRKLANRWLEVLWHCLNKGTTYDETIHAANRLQTRPLKPPA